MRAPQADDKMAMPLPAMLRRRAFSALFRRSMFKQNLLVALVDRCRLHAVLVVVASLLLAIAGGAYSWRHLGVSTDTDLLFSPDLPWRQRQMAFDAQFPQFRDLIVAVIDGQTPEAVDATAAALATALAADPSHFRTVRRPDASPFFNRNGLLFLDGKTLDDVLNHIIDAQPFLGQLAADPSARGLFAALSLIALGVQQGQADLTPFLPALQGFAATLSAAADGHPTPLSWETLLSGPLAAQAGSYRFVLAQPTLNFGALQPGGAAIDALHAAAASLPFVKDGLARVRVTGSVALSDEEFATVAQGALAGTIGSIVLITLWLLLAVHSWRLILPIVLTLLLGLTLTVSFAAIAVGTLNLVSVAFAILFVGIAVDFAIQFSVRYRDARLEFPDPAAALSETVHRVGAQIMVAAAATAAGFLAFVPTSFSGVAELGLIAGVGMVIAFLCTLFFLPAILTLFRPHAESGEVGFLLLGRLEGKLRGLRLPVLLLFAALGMAGIVLLPRLAFDSDPLHTKNPNTEAMQTLHDLMNNPLTDPYSIDIIEPSSAAAAAIATKLSPLPLVAGVISLQSFIPTDQPAKLAQIEDTNRLLAATLAPQDPAAPVTPADLGRAIAIALSQIKPALAKLPPGHPLAMIAASLHLLQNASDATLLAMNHALTEFLPVQIERLRQVLSVNKPVTQADIPPDIARDWLLPDGQARVHVLAKPQAQTSEGLAQFVRQVQSVAPAAGGSAVTIVETSDTIVGAFRSAAAAAVVMIAIILFVALRRLLHVMLVILPLLLSALLTVLVAVLLPLPLNFANIIALPLLLGVGVSFNIYFVMNWRAGGTEFLGTATARAVVFSALTTGTAFGSLALSQHPGTASMGDLLLLSLGCTLLTSLIFVPTLLIGLRSPS
jgi:hopanoid biosynthesis associated RND transporter like protein HpnN